VQYSVCVVILRSRLGVYRSERAVLSLIISGTAVCVCYCWRRRRTGKQRKSVRRASARRQPLNRRPIQLHLHVSCYSCSSQLPAAAVFDRRRPASYFGCSEKIKKWSKQSDTRPHRHRRENFAPSDRHLNSPNLMTSSATDTAAGTR